MTNQFKPNCFITLSNWGGVEIELNNSGDGVKYRFNYAQDNLDSEPIYEAEIIYEPNEEDPAGDFEAGFLHGGTFYNLNKAMRTNDR